MYEEDYDSVDLEETDPNDLTNDPDYLAFVQAEDEEGVKC